MSNKQESYILPECCNECVEADGFLGAKGCSNRTCECHKESHEGVEEEMIFRAFLQLLNDEQFVSSTDSETGETVEFPDAVEDQEAVIVISGQYDTDDLKKAVCEFVRKHTPLVAQTHTPQEEKEIASHCRLISNGYTYLRHRYDCETGKCVKCGKELSESCRKAVETPTLNVNLVSDIHKKNADLCVNTPIPTVKEESHTQGWEEQFDDKFDFLDCAALNGQEIKAFIKEVVEVAEKQAMLRQRHYDEKLARDREASAFDAGYAQCKVDAVAAVPHQRSDMFSYGEGAAAGGAQDGWNACRQAVLAALEVIKNKE